MWSFMTLWMQWPPRRFYINRWSFESFKYFRWIAVGKRYVAPYVRASRGKISGNCSCSCRAGTTKQSGASVDMHTFNNSLQMPCVKLRKEYNDKRIIERSLISRACKSVVHRWRIESRDFQRKNPAYFDSARRIGIESNKTRGTCTTRLSSLCPFPFGALRNMILCRILTSSVDSTKS